jgi:hypothetical protein
VSLINIDSIKDNYDEKTVAKAVVIVSILNVILFFMSTFIGGLMLVLLWGWFAVPLGLPAIGIFHALGLGFLVSGFMSGAYSSLTLLVGNTFKGEDRIDTVVRSVVTRLGIIVAYLYLMLGGFIFQLFM